MPKRLGLNRKSFSLLELLMVFCVIFILLGTVALYFNFLLKEAKETALRNELVNIRMTIMYYLMIKGRLPQDLNCLSKDSKEHLTKKGINDSMHPSYFLKAQRVDNKGYLLDPFMNRYAYNNEKGLVWSRTKGYENW